MTHGERNPGQDAQDHSAKTATTIAFKITTVWLRFSPRMCWIPTYTVESFTPVDAILNLVMRPVKSNAVCHDIPGGLNFARQVV